MPLPTDPIDRFNYFADEFLRQSIDWVELRQHFDQHFQCVRDMLAQDGQGDTTPDIPVAERLSMSLKPLLQKLYCLNQMHSAIGLSEPFPSIQ